MSKTIYMLGNEVSNKIKSSLNKDIHNLNKNGITPKLAAILVGDDPASKIYVNSKKKTFIKMNCLSDVYHLDGNIKESDLINQINELNNDEDIHGILLQCPLPKHLDEDKIISYINPDKDVDGLHPVNLGKLMQGKPNFIPCTPFGCIEILKHYNINIESKNIVIIGRSNLVGKPLFSLLSQKFKIGNATVTLCHSRTHKIDSYTKKADVIIVAIGRAHFLNKDMVKSGAIIIDVGINRIDDNSSKGYHIVGDADFDNLINKVSYITPVPGGVGPMTITMLLHNTICSAKKTSKKFSVSKFE